MIMNRSLPVTPYSMAHWLASIQAHGCFLQYGWRLSSRQLRRSADAVGQAAPDLRRIQKHPILFAHLTLAGSANWLAASGGKAGLRQAQNMTIAQATRARSSRNNVGQETHSVPRSTLLPHPPNLRKSQERPTPPLAEPFGPL